MNTRCWILSLFHKGKWIPNTTLAAHIYDEEFDRDSNVIEVFIGRLRKKLTQKVPKPIATLTHRGYCILRILNMFQNPSPYGYFCLNV